MNVSALLALSLSMAMAPLAAVAMPTVYPTGVTVYNPEKTSDGWTLIGPSWWNSDNSTYLIDMNGAVVKEWPHLLGHSAKMLPGGLVQGQYGKQKAAYLTILDFEGRVVRSFDKFPMNHDAQMEGNPVGYYFPGAHARPDGKMLINSQSGVIRDHGLPLPFPVEGNTIYEVDARDKVLWKWEISEHFDELGLSPEAVRGISRYDKYDRFRQNGTSDRGVDWSHLNAVSYVGANKWYARDPVAYAAFHPENILISSRHMSMLAIIDKATGHIVWRLGPDYRGTPELRRIGPIIGPHASHIIPEGLPGAGNLLIFDNGGYAGYGATDQDAPDGVGVMKRHYSRVLEINPVTLEVVWEYSATKAKIATANNPNVFFSPLQGNAQRLPNGNTLICEAAHGRVFEVTPELELVWEYVEPRWRDLDTYNVVFRAYRVPYDWVPQLTPGQPVPVVPPRLETFRMVPGPDGTPSSPVVSAR